MFFCGKVNTKYDHLGCVDVCDKSISKVSLESAEMCTNWLEDQIWYRPLHYNFAQKLIQDHGYCFSFYPNDELRRRLDSIDCTIHNECMDCAATEGYCSWSDKKCKSNTSFINGQALSQRWYSYYKNCTDTSKICRYKR